MSLMAILKKLPHLGAGHLTYDGKGGWFFFKNSCLCKTCTIKNYCTQPRWKNILALSVSRKNTVPIGKKKYPAYTRQSREKKFLVHESVEKIIPVPNHPPPLPPPMPSPSPPLLPPPLPSVKSQIKSTPWIAGSLLTRLKHHFKSNWSLFCSQDSW